MANYKQIKAIERKNIARLEEHFGEISNSSGIYILTREENGIKFGYVGQAKHILQRLTQHLSGYQHIDLSLKKHGLYSKENPTGYKLDFTLCGTHALDEWEQMYIKKYANLGYQLRNHTAGSQGSGKVVFDTAKQPKTYTEGKAYGRKQVLAEIKHIVDLHLVIAVKRDNKNDKKALDKFFRLINGE